MSVVELFNQIASNDFGFFQQVKTVADVMSKDVDCLTLDDTFASAEQMFRRNKLLHAPVLNPDDQSLVGVVSDRDLLRHRPRLLGTAAESDADHKVLKDGVNRFMTRNPVCCSRDCSPVKAISLMLEHHIDSIVVSADEQTVEGIVTPESFMRTLLLYHRVCTRDSDLRRLRLVDLDFRNGLPLDEIFARGAQTVRDVMTKDVECVQDDEPLSVAIEKMQDMEVRHLPVVNVEGALVGMLADRDILRCLATPENRSEEREVQFRATLFQSPDNEARHTPIRSVMNKTLNSVPPDTLLTEAIRVLQEGRQSGLTIVEPGTKELRGIITTSDILRVFLVVMQLGHLADEAR